ncbi:hypothetical protein D3C80_2019650 [compost metagenome]
MSLFCIQSLLQVAKHLVQLLYNRKYSEHILRKLRIVSPILAVKNMLRYMLSCTKALVGNAAPEAFIS